MKKDLTLLIMAAGMGSRFGGLKQMEPFGPNGEFLIDYSIYDAKQAGFNKVVFIIKKELLNDFKETVGKRVEEHVNVEYVFQELDDLPDGFTVSPDRVKPWGTAHAILSAKNTVKEDFIVINADDFYGRDAYIVAAEFLNKNDGNEYAIVGYDVENTLTENGSVKRGVCEVKNGYLEKIVESEVIKENGIIKASPLDGKESFIVDTNCRVSMNMLAFTPALFPYLEKKFTNFLESNTDQLTGEYLIPQVLEQSVKEGYTKVEIIPTSAKWIGITYKEDKPKVQNELNTMIEDGLYPNSLWEK